MKKIDKGFYLSEFLNTLQIQLEGESYEEIQDYKNQIAKITNKLANAEQLVYLTKYIDSLFKNYASVVHKTEEDGELTIKEVIAKLERLPYLNKSFNVFDYISHELYYPTAAIYDRRVFQKLIEKGFDFHHEEFSIDAYIELSDKDYLSSLIKSQP